MNTTQIPGCAYHQNEKEVAARRQEVLTSLRQAGHDKRVHIEANESRHGKNVYRGTAPNDLTPLDIALICDSNLCYGAMVERGAGAFVCTVYTD